jgi:hypothetical protein
MTSLRRVRPKTLADALSPAKVAWHAGLPLGAGGAGWIAHAATGRGLAQIIAVSAVLLAVVIASSLPKIIRAWSEAGALKRRSVEYAKLAERAADHNPGQILEILRIQSFNADLPEGRRMNDAAMVKGLAASGERGTPGQSDPEPGAKVIPLRPANSHDGPSAS